MLAQCPMPIVSCAFRLTNSDDTSSQWVCESSQGTLQEHKPLWLLLTLYPAFVNSQKVWEPINPSPPNRNQASNVTQVLKFSCAKGTAETL
jgi:hypothetical protein